MLSRLHLVIALHVVIGVSESIKVYRGDDTDWNTTGAAQVIPCSDVLQNYCPCESLADVSGEVLLLTSWNDTASLHFKGSSITVYGAILPDGPCEDYLPRSSLERLPAVHPISPCANTQAHCDVVLAHFMDLSPTDSRTFWIAPNSASVAIFNATVLGVGGGEFNATTPQPDEPMPTLESVDSTSLSSSSPDAQSSTSPTPVSSDQSSSQSLDDVPTMSTNNDRSQHPDPSLPSDNWTDPATSVIASQAASSVTTQSVPDINITSQSPAISALDGVSTSFNPWSIPRTSTSMSPVSDPTSGHKQHTPEAPTPSHKKASQIIIPAVLAPLGLCMVVLCTWCGRRRHRRQQAEAEITAYIYSEGDFGLSPTSTSRALTKAMWLDEGPTQCQQLTWALESAVSTLVASLDRFTRAISESTDNQTLHTLPQYDA